MELQVDVLSARGFYRLPPGSCLAVQCKFNGQLLETLPSTTRKGYGDPVWRSGGKLVWSLSHQDLARTKAIDPTLKLHVLARSVSPREGSPPQLKALGFVLLDIRAATEVSQAASAQRADAWMAVHTAGSGTESGGELRVALRLVAIRGGGGSPRAATADQGSELGRNGGMPPPPSPLHGVAAVGAGARVGDTSWAAAEGASFAAAAPEALRSALRTGGSEEPGPAMSGGPDADAVVIGSRAAREGGGQAYTLSVSLVGLERFEALLMWGSDSAAPRRELAPQQLWLSYKLFGVVVQTDSFPYPTQPGSATATCPFPPILDSFLLRSCLPDLAAFLAAAPPLQVG